MSLIKNKDMQFTIDFNLWGAEVDLLSILLRGEKSEINESDLKDYIQGVFERLILENTTIDNKKELAIMACKQKGMNDLQVVSYIRGWEQVGETINNE